MPDTEKTPKEPITPDRPSARLVLHGTENPTFIQRHATGLRTAAVLAVVAGGAYGAGRAVLWPDQEQTTETVLRPRGTDREPADAPAIAKALQAASKAPAKETPASKRTSGPAQAVPTPAPASAAPAPAPRPAAVTAAPRAPATTAAPTPRPPAPVAPAPRPTVVAAPKVPAAPAPRPQARHRFLTTAKTTPIPAARPRPPAPQTEDRPCRIEARPGGRFGAACHGRYPNDRVDLEFLTTIAESRIILETRNLICRSGVMDPRTPGSQTMQLRHLTCVTKGKR